MKTRWKAGCLAGSGNSNRCHNKCHLNGWANNNKSNNIKYNNKLCTNKCRTQHTGHAWKWNRSAMIWDRIKCKCHAHTYTHVFCLCLYVHKHPHDNNNKQKKKWVKRAKIQPVYMLSCSSAFLTVYQAVVLQWVKWATAINKTFQQWAATAKLWAKLTAAAVRQQNWSMAWHFNSFQFLGRKSELGF